jgi:hypothetical protein
MAALYVVFHAQRRHFCHQWKRFYYGDMRALITFISTPRQIRTRTDLERRLSSLCFRYWRIDDKIVYLISRDMRLIEHDSLHISMHLTLFDDSFSSPPFSQQSLYKFKSRSQFYDRLRLAKDWQGRLCHR